MRAWGHFVAIGLTGVAALAAPLAAPLAAAHAAPPTTDFVTMVGNGDYIAGNNARLWRSDAGSVDVSGSVRGTVTVQVAGGVSGTSYLMQFAAPPGQTLKAGSYVDAQTTSVRTAGHAGIDIFGEGRGCNETSGRFTVLDVAADLSRLSLVYEQHCEGAERSAFGTVRIGEPSDPSRPVIAPDRIAWPTDYLGHASRVVPVNVFAPADRSVAVGPASITDGDADFSVVDSTCPSVLDAGDSCTVYAGFRPAAPGHRTGAMTVGEQVVPLEGDTVPGRNAWHLESQPGDRFGGGTTDLDPTTSTFYATGDEHHVTLGAAPRSSRDPQWAAEFEAGPGQVLLPGTTVAPVSQYDAGSPEAASMRVGGYGTCSTIGGQFTVDEATYRQGVLRSFAVSFEQHCNGADAALTGTIAWHASVDDDTPPAGTTDLQAEPALGHATLSWHDPGDEDWAETVVRRSSGPVAPADVAAGTAVYHGRHGATDAVALPSGVDVSFAAFPVDSFGNVGAPATLTLQGTRASASASPAKIVAGATTQIGGQLGDADSAAGLAGTPVQLESRHASGPWQPVDSGTTDDHGHFAFSSSPTSSTSFRVTAEGSAGRLGTTSPVVPVAVSRKVSLASNHSRISRHGTVTLSTSVSPVVPAGRVALQVHRGSGWHTVSSRTLSSTSRTSFRVRPNRHGRYTYRVVEPADADHAVGTSRSVTVSVR